jgi:hypothetical protein
LFGRKKSRAQTFEQRVESLANTVVGSIRTEDGEYSSVIIAQECDEATLKRLGGLLLELDVHVEISEVCDGFNAIGNAIEPHVAVYPRGVDRPQYRNVIYPGEDTETIPAIQFKRLGNATIARTNPLLAAVTDPTSPYRASGIGPW